MTDPVQILSGGSSDDKITLISTLIDTENTDIQNLMISCLDDSDIRVRGEAFCSLMVNSHDISIPLLEGLKSNSKNIKSACVLLFGNRNDSRFILQIQSLVSDSNSEVRSCALGALGRLESNDIIPILVNSFNDVDINTRKSAVWSCKLLQYTPTSDEMITLSQDADSDMLNILKNINEPTALI
ncbi:MAG: HEAT repeat domain-containing protein [Candidatus Nitrosoabyssus spongiisocia]|nr:MAG: HEAT repeat domain-containing protein [Nitrosopumilaceae archaeon AB1(1)]